MFEQKAVRAGIIAHHLRQQAKPVVCFTCGNAARELRAAGLETVEVGDHGPLNANRWVTPGEVANMFPGHFDATSGHLPLWMMLKIGLSMTQGRKDMELVVPSGSGETAICAKLAMPWCTVTARYDDRSPATTFSPEAPLNRVVHAMCVVERITAD